MARPRLFGGIGLGAARGAGDHMGWQFPPISLRERYQRAGCYARLCLWTQYRELRAEFDEIEDREKPASQEGLLN